MRALACSCACVHVRTLPPSQVDRVPPMRMLCISDCCGICPYYKILHCPTPVRALMQYAPVHNMVHITYNIYTYKWYTNKWYKLLCLDMHLLPYCIYFTTRCMPYCTHSACVHMHPLPPKSFRAVAFLLQSVRTRYCALIVHLPFLICSIALCMHSQCVRACVSPAPK